MSSEKTEQPTPKRLDDARKKGQVAISKDVTSTAVLIAVFAYLGIFWNAFMNDMQDMFLLPVGCYGIPFKNSFSYIVGHILDYVIKWVLPMMIIVIIVGVFSCFFQTGLVFSFESVKPSLKKVNPAENIKKTFSMKNLFEFLKNVLKVTFLSILLYKVIEAAIPTLMLMPFSKEEGVMVMLAVMLRKIVINTAFAYVVIAAIDFYFQKKQHTKSLMMTKDEVKREYKEMEGNPEIKGMRKQLHREMLNDNMVQKTKKSSVVVTNPTHRAVALYYDAEETGLPVVTAKGEGMLALKMIEAAKEAGVPVMRDVGLAHALYDQVELDQYVPTDMLEAVAEVLRWVQQLKEQNEE